MPLDLRTDEAVHKEGGDSVERAITIDASLVAAQDSGSLRRQETMGVLLLKLVVEILKLKKRVKKLEIQRKSSISHPRRRIYRQVESFDDDLDEEDASKQGRKSDKTRPMFKDSDFDGLDDDMENVEGETVYAATFGVSTAGTLVNTARPTVSTAGPSTSAAGTSTSILEYEMVIMADTLIAIRQTRTKPSYLPRPTSVGKVIMVRPDPPVKIKRSDQGDLQLFADAELAQLLHQEELAQVERRQRERAAQEEASIAALYEEYDTIQASIDVDALFATRLQQEGRERVWINDFVPMDSEKEEKKSVEPESVGKKGKRINRVVDSALKQKSSKKQKMMQEQESAKCDEDAAVDYEHEKEELRMWLTVVLDEEQIVDPKILSAKYPIVDWESQNLGNVDMEDLHVYNGGGGVDNQSRWEYYFRDISKSKAYIILNKHTIKVKESLNVTFDVSHPPTKLSPLVDDDVGEEEAIENNIIVVNNNNIEDESVEVDEVVNIKVFKNHPLEQVIGNLNQRTLRSQAQNQSNFFCFISTIEPNNVNEALGDETWVVAMQEELNQFIANDV
ncbi:hypothetical protein Tco_0918186 [Tanacetum coccineum]